MELSQKEMYCTAKILQSVLFSDDRGLFHNQTMKGVCIK